MNIGGPAKMSKKKKKKVIKEKERVKHECQEIYTCNYLLLNYQMLNL